ncbi:DUF2510 domain-containing protein [Kribbella sp. NPDC004875]|uniref:DUF2510 domain-containing protein n=1 Tax=Kribbella sp. NPDC004875 TaxID=3364107 RepID=UPI003691D352
MSNPPAGWYPDPTGQPNTIRFWNGEKWTNKTEKEDAAAQEDPSPQPSPTPEPSTPGDAQPSNGPHLRAVSPDDSTQIQSYPETAPQPTGQPTQSTGATVVGEPGPGDGAEHTVPSPAERAKATWNAPEIAPAPSEHWTQREITEAEAAAAAAAAVQETRPAEQTNGWTLKLAPDPSDASDDPATESGAATGTASTQGWSDVSWTAQPRFAPTPKEDVEAAGANIPPSTVPSTQPTSESNASEAQSTGTESAGTQSSVGEGVHSEGFDDEGITELQPDWGSQSGEADNQQAGDGPSWGVEAQDEDDLQTPEKAAPLWTVPAADDSTQQQPAWGASSNQQPEPVQLWGDQPTTGQGQSSNDQQSTTQQPTTQQPTTQQPTWDNEQTTVQSTSWNGDQSTGEDTSWSNPQAGGPQPSWENQQAGGPQPSWENQQGGGQGGGWGHQESGGQDAGWGDQQSGGQVSHGWDDPHAGEEGWGAQQGAAGAGSQAADNGWGVGDQHTAVQESGPWGQQATADTQSGQQVDQWGGQSWPVQQSDDQQGNGWGDTHQSGQQSWGATQETGQSWGSGQQGGDQAWGSGQQQGGQPWGAQQGQGSGGPQALQQGGGQQAWGDQQTQRAWGDDGNDAWGGQADLSSGVGKDKSKGKKPKGPGGGGGPFGAKLPLIIAGGVALVLVIALAVVLITKGGDDKQAGPNPTGAPTQSTSPTGQPTGESSTKPGQSKNPKLHEGFGRIASDAISFPRRNPPWSDRKRLVQQLLNSAGQRIVLQENANGSDDWSADIFVGGLGTGSGFNGDPKATAATLSVQLRKDMYGTIPVTYTTIANGAVKRSGKAGWFFQQTVTAKSAAVTDRVLTLTVAVFDLGDGTAVAYISGIPNNRADLKAAESQAYKGINVG